MRVLPVVSLDQGDQEVDEFALNLLRCLLVLGLATKFPAVRLFTLQKAFGNEALGKEQMVFSTAALVGRAMDASLSAFDKADAASLGIIYANNAMGNKGNSSDQEFVCAIAVQEAERFGDIIDATKPGDVSFEPIELPPFVKALTEAPMQQRSSVVRSTGPWSFWANWYDRAIAGTPLPWELQSQIALIRPKIWRAGPEAVAEEIKRIQLEYVATSLPQAGGIRFDDKAAVFRKVVPKVARPQLLGATLAQVDGALEDVLADPSNGLHERSREVQVLSRMLERFGNDPQRIEMDCTSVYGSLARQLASEELPPSEQNLALRDAVSELAEGIRATDPEIAENRRILSEVKLRNMSEENLAAFQEALPVLEAVSDAELGAEFREDIEDLADRLFAQYRPAPDVGERNPGIRAAYEEEIRLFKRIADMAILAKTKDIAVKCGQQIKKEPISFLGLLAGLIGIAVALF